mgnify:FL=1
MNLLIDCAPKEVDIDGELVPIESNFRTSILFELMLLDPDIPEPVKMVQGLGLYYPTIPKNTQAAVERMVWFYRGGQQEEDRPGKGKPKSAIYSFDYDDEMIYSAFRAQYGIDLQDIEYLHWWQFKALFHGLTEEHEIVKAMGYRAADITTDMSKEQKKHLNEMKELYKLPLSKSEKDKQNAIEEALLSGGDLTQVL